MNIPQFHIKSVHAKRWLMACGALAVFVCTNSGLGQTGSTLEQWTSAQSALLANPDVVAHYDFQEGEGSVLKNKSKAGPVLDGVIFDSEWEEGRWSGKKALKFNGKTSLVEIPSHPDLCPIDKAAGGTGEMTIEAWIKVVRMPTSAIIDKSSLGSAKNTPYAIWITGSRLIGYLGQQPGNRVDAALDEELLAKNEWTHVALTVDHEKMVLFRNGVRGAVRNREETVSTDNGAPLLIGAWGKQLGVLNGWVDELIIYKKVLDDAEIEKHASFGPFVPEIPGPPTISLVSPLGGENFAAGSWHVIQWDTRKVTKTETIKIELTEDEGKTWQVISETAPNTGEFVWEVAVAPAPHCRIRVTVNQAGLVAQSKQPFVIGPQQDIPNYEWEEVTLKAPFPPRDGLGVLAYKNRMWLLGGWNPTDKVNFPRICINDVWSSQDGLTWTLEKKNTYLDKTFDVETDWEGRHCAGYVVFQDKMWILGSDANQGYYMYDVWNSEDGKSWKLVNKDKPVPWGLRALQHTLVFKNKIWVMGGQTMPTHAPSDEMFYRDIWTTGDGVNWEQVIPKEPYWSARGMIGGNAVFKDRMWILGGGTFDTVDTPSRKYHNDVWSSPDGVNWERNLEKAPWAPRQFHDVATFDGRLWVLEGFGPEKKPGNRNDVWHSSDGVNWYPLPNTPWSLRHAAGVVVHDNALWMISGNNMQSDVWKLVRAK